MMQQQPDDGGMYMPTRVTYDGKRMRSKPINRKTVDFNSPVINHLLSRQYTRDHRDLPFLRPIDAAQQNFMSPAAYRANPATSITSRFIHTSTNKARCPINTVCWTPEGRRLITGSSSGEFTLWNGLTFNFETILQAHDPAVRAMVWSHNENWMISADQGGDIKYWEPNMNNVKHIEKAHEESIRGLSFCSTDKKFVSCSDDVSIKIWDFAEGVAESTLKGHGWDVKCIAWHPHTSLIVSGSKDNDVKITQRIATLHGHKNTVLDVEWNKNGNWILTASRDQMIKLYDIRTMRELQSFRGHKKEVTCLAWHPFHEEFFVSGGSDGIINFWQVGDGSPVGDIVGAHENSVWSLAWHPVGHILASGSNDHTTKFWCRERPGSTMDPKFHQAAAYMNHYDPEEEEKKHQVKEELSQKFPIIPGYIGDLSKQDDIPCLGSAYMKPSNNSIQQQHQPQYPNYAQKMKPPNNILQHQQQYPTYAQKNEYPSMNQEEMLAHQQYLQQQYYYQQQQAPHQQQQHQPHPNQPYQNQPHQNRY